MLIDASLRESVECSIVDGHNGVNSNHEYIATKFQIKSPKKKNKPNWWRIGVNLWKMKLNSSLIKFSENSWAGYEEFHNHIMMVAKDEVRNNKSQWRSIRTKCG